MKLDVLFAPDQIGAPCEDTLCVVADVLRATTTIITALSNGAREVRPFTSAAEARKAAESLKPDTYLLGGEEQGLKIAGFDLGNSPLEYSSSAQLSGRMLLFATTNGTPTLLKAYRCSRRPVYLAALINLSAVAGAVAHDLVQNRLEQALFICSGRHGKPCLEDLFCMGLLVRQVDRRLREGGGLPALTDSAMMAAAYAAGHERNPMDVLTAGEHGRYLQSIGFSKDIEFAGKIDSSRAVPVFDGSRIVSL